MAIPINATGTTKIKKLHTTRDQLEIQKSVLGAPICPLAPTLANRPIVEVPCVQTAKIETAITTSRTDTENQEKRNLLLIKTSLLNKSAKTMRSDQANSVQRPLRIQDCPL